MKHDVTDKLIEIREKYRKKRRWQTILTFLSTVVVFCVAYALVLPAITMERATTVAESSIPNTATVTKFSEVDGSGSTYYVLYVRSSTRRYALDGNGNAVQVTEKNGALSWSTVSQNMFWTFSKQNNGTYQIQNVGTSKYLYPGSSQLLTSNSGAATLKVASNSQTATIYGSNRYVRYNSGFSASTSGTSFYIAAIVKPTYNVLYDGSNDGIMSLGGSEVKQETVEENQEITLPVSWKSPDKYPYTLRGWYDVKGHQYYAPGEKVTVTGDMLLYADWEATTYDVGRQNEHVVESVDTNDFIATHMFDYGSIFNMLSTTHTGTMSTSSYSETWSVVQSGKVPYKGQTTLGFIFRDWDRGSVSISYPSGSSGVNDNQSSVTSGILNTRSTLIDTLFSLDNAYNAQTKTGILGKSYVGPANYLYQYDNDSSSEFYGYYYYDSKLNAASYNQSDKRFYIYNYLERTSDSWRDGGAGEYSDFLPYNSPYIHNNDSVNKKQVLRRYDDSGSIKANANNYQYDAKYSHNATKGDETQYAGTNYWFGMSSDIRFYLPNDSGTGGNIATTGKPMVFSFSGDDDVWVFVDGVLVLDIGGIHGIQGGEINFSTGEVTVSDKQVSTLMNLAASTNSDIDKAGEHHLTIYYLERGGSQSNCAIYFNIAPRYLMKLEKTDAATTELLNGAEFSVYTDAACITPAELWEDEDAFNRSEDPINTFTIENGKGSIWGFCAGNTYYIKESKPPDGYLLPSGVIRMTLDNHGTATYDIDVISDGGEVSDGFRVIGFRIDDVTHEIYLVISNRLEHTIDVGVEKVWDVEEGEEIPDNVEVYLEANGHKIGENIALNQGNNWTYSWAGLSKNDAEGKEITYDVKEVPVPGYRSEVSQGEGVVSYIQWLPVQTLVDGETHLLVSEQGALTVTRGSTLTWTSIEAARTDTNAQWKAVANGLGFRLENGAGAKVAFNTSNKTFYVTTGTGGLQELHYNEHGLRVYHDEQAYYLNADAGGNIGSAGEDSGIQFDLKEKVTVEGIEFTVTNTPLGQQTSLQVKKIWDDGAEKHSEDSVTICLQAEHSDTGYELILNEENNWTGRFEGLPYYQEDGITKIKYSVVEKEVRGYTTEYSEVIEKENEMTYEVTITNKLIVYELPVTGGMGTIPLYMFGGILLVLSSILFYKKYEKRGENKR